MSKNNKKTKRYKIKPAGRAIISLFILAFVGGLVYLGIDTGFIKLTNDNKTKEVKTTQEAQVEDTKIPDTEKSKVDVNKKSETDTINLSLDEWIGYATILQANGGLTTQKGSIFDRLGIKVNVNVINDATQSSNALIKGELDGAGYTINRMAFLSKKFKDSKTDVIMPFLTNYSNGGDGIIATTSIKTIEDLVGAKIGVPQFSESQAMIVWFVNQSDLTDKQKKDIIDNLILFETPDETAKAFFAGQIDVAGTWQPYLSQAESTTNSHILFSTANSTKLIMSGVTFRKDFAEENPQLVSKFIDGTLQAMNSYDKDLDVLRESMPMFNGMSDEDIKGMTLDASLASWKNNMNILKGDGIDVYSSMCDVWKSIGEKADKSNANEIFDNTYMEMLKDKYETIDTTQDMAKKVKVTKKNEQKTINAKALLTKSASVNFVINTAKFSDTKKASKSLDKFIEVAKILDGTIIQIEGNTDPNPISDPKDKANLMLSKQRANSVKQYFVMNGISADRIIVIGNGSSKPKYKNDTDKHKALNRRTDVSFKCIEQ